MIKQVPAGFTLQELRAYLEGENGAGVPAGFYTAREWAEQFGIHINTMRQLLQKAKKEGKLAVREDKRERLDGHILPSPVYAFVLEGQEEGDNALRVVPG